MIYKNYSKDNIIIQTLGNIINKMNYIINENKKNSELMKNEINKIYQKYDKLKGNNPIANTNREYKELIGNDGSKYKGQVLNWVPDGKGTCYYSDGERYEGDWRNGIKDGKGKYYFKDGSTYEGDWRNDKQEGKGMIIRNNGMRYTGQVVNGLPEGKGIVYYPNGERYEGNFF